MSLLMAGIQSSFLLFSGVEVIWTNSSIHHACIGTDTDNSWQSVRLKLPELLVQLSLTRGA